MTAFILFAKPWWVNLLILVPIIAGFVFRRGLTISKVQLMLAALFAISFGLVEASVVVYLRAALGILPGYQLLDLIGALPKNLLGIELYREAATIVILVCVSFLAVRPAKERWAIFLWMFAFWDLFFYVFMWVIIRWPYSLTTTDILFLIPNPWIAQVWFPILVSLASILSIAVNNGSEKI
jgi:hypothetical protein